MIENDAARDAIRSTVTDMLSEYGVEDPALGPPADWGHGAGPFGQESGVGQSCGQHNGANGQSNGPADGTSNGPGQDADSGPHGPVDGSCLN